METQETQSEEVDPQSAHADEQQPSQVHDLQNQEQWIEQYPETESKEEGCRGTARCVAYCVIVVSIMVAGLAIGGGVLAVVFIHSAIADEEMVNVAVCVYLVLYVLTVLLSVIAVYSATLLLSATSKYAYPPDAIGKAQCWFYYSIVFAVFLLVAGVIGVSLHFDSDIDQSEKQKHKPFSISHFPNALLQIIAQCIVYKYVKELKATRAFENEDSADVPKASVVTLYCPSSDCHRPSSKE